METCLRFPVPENRSRRLRTELLFLFPLPPTVQFDVVHQHLDLQHKQHTKSSRQHVLNLHVLVSLCSLDSSDSIWLWEFLLPKVPHLLRFPFRHLHGILPSPMGATSRFRVFVGLTSALLCHPRCPTADRSSQDNDQHRSHCWSLSISRLGSSRN